MRSWFHVLPVALLASSCADGHPKGPTSVYLTIQNGPNVVGPDELRVSGRADGVAVFDDERLPMAGPLQPQGGGVLGTVTLYVDSAVANLDIEVSGYLNQVLVSSGATSVRVVRDRQVSTRVVLLEIVDGGQTDDATGADVGTDAGADGPADVGLGDGGVPDLAPDVGADLMPDSSPDVPSEVASDSTSDVTPDIPPDAGQEMPPASGIFAHYKFDESTGTVAVDSSGNGRDGTLMGGATLGQPGQIGNGVSLNGMTGSYVALPAGMLDPVRDVTIATWVRVRTARNWQRIFDFAADATRTMYLVPQDTAVLRFAITTGGLQAEQRLLGSAPLTTGTWQHVAIVLGPGGGTMYLNGEVAVTNATLALRPANLLPRNLWLGRSQNSMSPYFDGEIDEFRVYDRALSAAEISALFSQR